jgi:hypothetical protein
MTFYKILETCHMQKINLRQRKPCAPMAWHPEFRFYGNYLRFESPVQLESKRFCHETFFSSTMTKERGQIRLELSSVTSLSNLLRMEHF